MASLAYSVAQAATALGISEWAVYRYAKAGRLPSMRVGRRLLIPRAALERFLAEQAAASLEPETAS